MKKIISIFLSIVLILGSVSCSDWLDVNTDPDNPNNESATEEIRLPWIQYYYMYAWGTANTRANAICQMVASTSRTNNMGRQTNWNPNQSISTTVYQCWFTGAASNIPDLLKKAEAHGAYHYMGAALVLKSMGYIMMADLYGEMPYTAAVSSDYSPSYDTGDIIYHGCLADLDKAIEYFDMVQKPGATPLASGDSWNGGDVAKWKKLAYGLKARWLNNLSKTSEYDPDAILAAIANAPTSNGESIILKHKNVETSTFNYATGDAYGLCVTWDSMAWGTSQRLNRWYVNLLTNFKGSGVEDPRANKLIPSGMYKAKLKADGSIASYEWLRDCGLNVSGEDSPMKGNRYVNGNLCAYLTLAIKDDEKEYTNENILKYYPTINDFIDIVNKYYTSDNVTIEQGSTSVKITYHPGALYVNDTNPLYVEDIKYIQLRADGLFETEGLAANDMNCYYTAARVNSQNMGYVVGTGSFYARPDSDSDILTYSEMCFIKAEVYFRKGDKASAYNAYIDGIKANFARMNTKLQEWKANGSCKTAKGFDVSFAYAPMEQSDIDAYMSSEAVKHTAGTLTMSDIMMQKFIAMGPNYQNYNDMRRFNYYAGTVKDFGVIYTEMSVPGYRTQDLSKFNTDPKNDSFYPRRWMFPSFETGYNSNVVNELTQKLYGVSAMDYSIYSIPVWWDKEN